METKAQKRDDRLSQNPLVCLIFPFIARRESVAVDVAGWQVYQESNVICTITREQASKTKALARYRFLNKVLMQASGQRNLNTGQLVNRDISNVPSVTRA